MNATAQPIRTVLPAAPEDQVRADMYALVSCLYYAAPDAALLAAIAGADELIPETPDGGLGRAWRELQAACANTPAEAASDEFGALFISVGPAPLIPYASYYLTGFLNERPLALLREQLAGLGLARNDAAGESEDHLSSLADVMRFLVLGDAETPPADLAMQKRFFTEQIGTWYTRALDAIEQAPEANLYKRVACFTRAFFEIEVESFDIDD